MSSTSAIRFGCRAFSRGEEHAEGDEEITEDFCVAGQNICHEDISEFTILSLCYSANADSFQDRQGTVPATTRYALNGEDKCDDQDEEVEVGQNLPLKNGGVIAMSDSPKEQERQGERDREDGSEAICREVVGGFCWRVARRIANEGRHILWKNKQGKSEGIKMAMAAYNLDDMQIV